MSEATIHPFKRASLTQLDNFELADDQEVELSLVFRASVANQSAQDLKWRQSAYDHVDFTGSAIKRLSFSDCRFDYCQIANADWSEALVDRSEIESSKLTGVKLNEGRIQTVRFSNCKLDFAQFQGLKSKQLIFDHCDLQHAYFNNADLRNAVFDHCDLSHADFSQARLMAADMRGSTIEGIRIDPTKLPNVKVDMAQAIYLVQMLGLEIE